MSTQDKSDAQKNITKWASTDGHFRRQVSSFRDIIEKDGKFQPEKGRYHIFVSYACPWAHRVLITRKLLKLEDIIGGCHEVESLSRFDKGDSDEFPGADHDPIQNSNHVRDLYFKSDPEYSGRFTVPIVWDTKTSTIVNNESSEIIRFLNTAFRDLAEPSDIDIYPEALRKEIDDFHSWVYDTVNNGVYKCGFATTQEAYESAVGPLFQSLDRLEKMIEGKDYYIGDRLTEADIRLYTTIVRFDPVYHGHFKCNLGSIRHNYPNINRWMKNLYWNVPAFKDTTNFEHTTVLLRQTVTAMSHPSSSTGATRTPSTTNSRSTPLLKATDECKYDEVKKSKLTLVKEENAELKERIAQLERQLRGISPPPNASCPDNVKQAPSSTFSQMTLGPEEDPEYDYELEEDNEETRGDPIRPDLYEAQPHQQPPHVIQPEHISTVPVQHNRPDQYPQPEGFDTVRDQVQVPPGQYRLPTDQHQPAYQDPYYPHVPHSTSRSAEFTQTDSHAQPASYGAPHVQTGPLSDVHGYPTWPPTPNDTVPPSASSYGFTPSPSTKWYHVPHLSPETTPGSPGTLYPSAGYPRGAMFKENGRYFGGAMPSYSAYQGTTLQVPVARHRPVPSPPVFGQDLIISFFQRWRTESQPQAYVAEERTQAQNENNNWALVGNWWERDDLSVAHRDYLLGILLPYRKQIGFEIWVPDFLASLHRPPQGRPHPGLMWMLYTFAAFFSGDPELKALVPEFMERARRNLEESFARGDRLFDYIRGQTLYASIKYMMGRFSEGGLAKASACHAAIICGLHKITTPSIAPVTQSQEKSKYHVREIGFQLPPATSPREHGERIAAFWQLILVDYSEAATTGVPAMFRDDGDERSRIETVFPRPLEEYLSGDANKVPYGTLGDIFTSRDIPNPPDTTATLQIKATALLERAVRLATKWNGKHISVTDPNKYGDEYNTVLQAIQHFKRYLPGLYPREGDPAESQLHLTSRGLVYERLFPHFMVLNAEIEIYNILEEQELAREQRLISAREMKNLILQLTETEVEQIGVLLANCFDSAIKALMKERRYCRAYSDEAGAEFIDKEIDVISHALKVLGRSHHVASLQSDLVDKSRFEEYSQTI
ncbi:Glutathione S-transferase, partial [Rhizoctonia solani]